ncbi:hypothetical protein BKA81DRAFT_361156 [Phyllosticta paracitricarpa]
MGGMGAGIHWRTGHEILAGVGGARGCSRARFKTEIESGREHPCADCAAKKQLAFLPFAYSSPPLRLPSFSSSSSSFCPSLPLVHLFLNAAPQQHPLSPVPSSPGYWVCIGQGPDMLWLSNTWEKHTWPARLQGPRLPIDRSDSAPLLPWFAA